MSSRWQTIAVPFRGGVDTKSDSKSVSPTRLVDLKNGVFTNFGAIRKRHGYDTVDPVSVDGATLEFEALSSYQNALVATGDENLYAYDSGRETWLDTGYFNHVAVSTDTVNASTLEQTGGDQAEANGTLVRAFYVSGDLYVYVYDTATGTQVNYIDVGSNAESVRVVRVGNYIHVIYGVASATDLRSIPINTLTPENATFSDGVVIASDLNNDCIFDACENSDQTNALFAWYANADDTLRFARLLPSGAVENASEVSTSSVISAISVSANSNLLGILWQDTTGNFVRLTSVQDVNNGLSTVNSIQNLSTSYTAVKLTLGLTSAGWFSSFHETATSTPWDTQNRLYYGTISTTSLGIFGSFLTYGFTNASEVFVDDDEAYVFLRHEGPLGLQSCYFLWHLRYLTHPVDGNYFRPRVVAKVAAGEATSATDDYRLPYFSSNSAGVVKGLLPRRDRVLGDQEGVYLHEALLQVCVDGTTSAYTASEYGDTLYYPGGILWMYDSGEPCEAGMLLYPEIDVDLGSTDPADHTGVSVGAGSTKGAGVRSYKFYYEWTSSTGERHRSTAIPFSVNIPANNQVTFTLPTLCATNRTDNGANVPEAREHVAIVGYRTTTNGSVYYRISSTDPTATTGDNRYVFNSTTVASVTFIDDLPDADLLTREIDGNTGGLLDNVAAPASTVITEAKGRIFLAGGTISDNRVVPSKKKVEKTPAEFNDTLYIQLPNRGGAVTAMGELNDVLVVFKRNYIYLVAGEGPNNFGFGAFADPQEVATDVGCVDARSLVEVPQGYMFQSAKGIYLLDKGFNVTYVGAPVEAYNAFSVVSAELVPDQNIAVFLTADERTLVYDYIFDAWSTFTNHRGQSATIWQNNYCFIQPDSTLRIQNTDKYTDGGLSYALSLKTAPIRLGDLQEWWRCRRIYIMGDYFSAHGLRMDVWFNREKAPQETVTWDTSDFIDTSDWGDEATWGADATWGGDINGVDYQMSYRLARQKVQTVAFEFTEVPGTELGRAFELTELALEWAPQNGLGRLASARRK